MIWPLAVIFPIFPACVLPSVNQRAPSAPSARLKGYPFGDGTAKSEKAAAPGGRRTAFRTARARRQAHGTESGGNEPPAGELDEAAHE